MPRSCSRHPWRFRALAAIFAACAALLNVPAQNGARPPSLGVVKGSNRPVHAIAVPSFLPEAGSARQLPPAGLGLALNRDLLVTGLFKQPANPGQVEPAHRAWLANKANFGVWTQIGAQFLCSCSYAVDGAGNLTAKVYVFETTSGSQVFGKAYNGFTADRPERLAHRIADDILAAVALEPGGVSGSFLAFVSSRTGHKELFSMDASGDNQRQLTNDQSLVTAPCWGARGQEIYFTTYKRFNPDLIGVTMDGRQRWPISEYAGNNISPDWNERAGRIALVLGKDGNQEIYTMSRSGEAGRRVTQAKSIDSAPAWSPDGSRMAFVSNRGGGPQIYVMGADGSSPRRVSFAGNYCTSPTWSPDGSRIAYVARAGGRHEIMILDIASGQGRQITRGRGNSEDPAWSPNSEYIAFANDQSGKFQVYRMRADGSNPVQLTSQGENTSPSWGPAFW